MGWYVYAGSALGGLGRRTGRYAAPPVLKHWHIDYLRQLAEARELLVLRSAIRWECSLAAWLLAQPGASAGAKRFGVSDCRCVTHLIYFAGRPALREASGLGLEVIPLSHQPGHIGMSLSP